MIDSGAAVSVCPDSYRPDAYTVPNKNPRYLQTATGQQIEVIGKICFVPNWIETNYNKIYSL